MKNMLKHANTAEERSLTYPLATDQLARPLPRFGDFGWRAHGKRVWIDIDNSPHVPFFLPIIDELRARGIEVLLTARDMYQVRDLLQFFGLTCKIVGGHYGKNKVLKVAANCSRALQLFPTALQRPDLAVSHGSRAQILVCKTLNIPVVLMHDYEHSTKTGFVKPDWVFAPEVISDRDLKAKRERTIKYPGIKEDVYVPRFRPDPSLLQYLGVSTEELVVTLRPPATEAHYHNPESEILFAETVRLLSETPGVRAITLPRNTRQAEQLRQEWAEVISSGKMIIPAQPVDGLNLIWFSDLVISGGGTMNREAAALGVPVYSIFRGKIGAVDRYLAKTGRMTLIESVEQVRDKIVLIRRKRAVQSDIDDRPTLRFIVENIVSILEEQCLPIRPSAR